MHTLILVAGDDVDSILLPFSSNIEVDPYEVPIDGEDLGMLASHYGLQVTDTALLVQRIKEYFGTDGFERDGRLFRVTRVNPQMQFDWYVIGGRWAAPSS